MIIEHMIFQVPEKDFPTFMEGEKVWTQSLMGCPGLVNKEIWIDRADCTKVHLVITWASMVQWKSIPESLLEEIHEAATEARGGKSFKLLETKEYDYQNAMTGFM